MKILHICNGAQGNSPFYKFLFNALTKHHVEQSVIAPVWKEPTIDYEDIHCEYFYRDSDIITRLRFNRKIRKLTKFTLEKVNIESFDVIHAHTWFSDGAVAYNLYKEYGIPYIIAIRNTDINLFFRYFLHLRNLGYNILKNASQIIFISPAYKDNLVNHLLPQKIKNKISGKISIIPNGAFPFWLNNRYQKTTVSSPVKLLSIGTIDPNKNYLSLCYAIELLRKNGKEVELTLVGKGSKDNLSYLRRLEKYIKDKPHITLIEKQSQEALLKIYRNHDIFVLPSHKETFGLVYIEALTQGLPIVYTKQQGVDGYFEPNEAGYAVNPENIEEIAQAISLTISNYSELITHIAQLDFSVFNWESIAERYFKIYQRCIY
ncbi:MAG: glycosyltransferase family 4 protein [Bacteroidetes bacterium]|nr:glycosyltransferase family 4 protein [Bacteroidota bacterium]MCL1969617.1 glycosyltransferase family 4 protein [Bacteroidota bacterium]